MLLKRCLERVTDRLLCSRCKGMELLEWEKAGDEEEGEYELVWGGDDGKLYQVLRPITLTRSVAISPISNPRCRSHAYSKVLARGVSTGQPNINARCRTRTSTC